MAQAATGAERTMDTATTKVDTRKGKVCGGMEMTTGMEAGRGGRRRGLLVLGMRRWCTYRVHVP